MSKIVKFNSNEEFVAYRKSKTRRQLGSGSEGTCYLGNDGLAYKDLSDGLYYEQHEIDKIITTSEIQNDAFLFPHTLFAVGDNLIGYTTDVVSEDCVNFDYILFNGMNHIDFNKLAKAYPVFKEKASELARDGIKIHDLSYNTMFDGEKLFGIDTCYYTKVNEDITAYNIACVDNAMRDIFWLHIDGNNNPDVDRNMDVISYLHYVEDNYTNHNSEKGKPYIKQ